VNLLPLLVIISALGAPNHHGVVVVDHGGIVAQVENRDGSIIELDMGKGVHPVHKGGDVTAAWNGVYGNVRWTVYRVA
jgi:hypothetical protein